MPVYSVSFNDENGTETGTFSFQNCRGEGAYSPRLVIELSARTRVSTPPIIVDPRYMSLRVKVDFPNVKEADRTIGLGQLRLPAPAWHNSHETRFTFDCPLTDQSIRLIEENLREDNPRTSLELSGIIDVRSGDSRGTVQLQQSLMMVPVSRQDWIKSVLEPIGFGDYYFLAIKASPASQFEPFRAAVQHLDKANTAYFQGVDSGVFTECYNAGDPGVFSGESRGRLLTAFTDQNKRGAVDDIIKATHRFANGGRHVPEQGLTRGGFDVNHADAEFVRILVGAGLAYLSKSQPTE